MVLRRQLRALAVCLALLVPLAAGCQLNVPSLSPSASVTPASRDFTLPGAAEREIGDLMAAANSSQLIMAQVARDTASISVLAEGDKPQTWAYRDGEVKQVTSDLAYVDQATFDIDDFNISDVGSLFAAAAEQSESEENQTLQIVDYSGGQVMMTVTTNPESRTVFFNPDGSLLETLDFQTLDGLTAGFKEVVGIRSLAYSVGIKTSLGIWADFPALTSTTVTRRQRTAKVPATTIARSEETSLPLISTSHIEPTTIWEVAQRTIREKNQALDTEWSVEIDDREERGAARMYFTVGGDSLVTDLDGDKVSN
ncbi:MAG: hypothetical protein WCF12_03705 [Propionicimonas sp.]